MSEVLQVKSASLTDQGRKRPHNEDFVAWFEPDDLEELETNGNLYIVADGVGGAAKGERASRYAAQKVLYEYYQNPEIETGKRLSRLMRQAGNEINQYAQENEPFTRMATTMVAVVVRQQTLTVANVGDSRAYIIRDREIEQITRDHSLVGELIRDGVITEEQAQYSKNRNRITRSLGGEPDVHVDTFSNIPLQPGDKILLCSDGLTKYAAKEDLIQFTAEGSPDEIVNRLVDFANQSGGADNVSAILIYVGQSLSATVPVAVSHGLPPSPVDWETMATLPGAEGKTKKTLWPLPKEYIALATTGLALLIVVVLLIAFFLMRKTSALVDTQNATQTSTQSPLTLTAQAIILNPPATVSATSTEENPTSTPTFTGTVSPPTDNLAPCKYTVQEGDLGIVMIKEKLDSLYESMTEVSCAENQGPTCKEAFDPNEENPVIQIGWILVFPNVIPLTCEENNGQPIIGLTETPDLLTAVSMDTTQ